MTLAGKVQKFSVYRRVPAGLVALEEVKATEEAKAVAEIAHRVHALGYRFAKWTDWPKTTWAPMRSPRDNDRIVRWEDVETTPEDAEYWRLLVTVQGVPR
jgi:hypothetical protein